mgnify:CR=1 FL=1
MAVQVEHLTLLEKAALLVGKSVWETRDLPRHGVRPLWLADGPHGVRKQVGSADHLGLNASEPATCFPTAAAIACSWDVDLAERVGAALGAEAAAQGLFVHFAATDPLVVAQVARVGAVVIAVPIAEATVIGKCEISGHCEAAQLGRRVLASARGNILARARRRSDGPVTMDYAPSAG